MGFPSFTAQSLNVQQHFHGFKLMAVGMRRAAREEAVITVTVKTQTAQRSYDRQDQWWLDPCSQMTDGMEGLASSELYSKKGFSGYTHGKSILPQRPVSSPEHRYMQPPNGQDNH